MGTRGKLPKNKLPVSTTPSACEPSKLTKADMERQRRWAAEDGLRTLNQAEEIRQDKQRMADIKSLATEQMQNLKRFVK